ncbi:5'/3'-nucleotidase SurE [Pseudonocardia sp. KRD291]|uniref:5'/3'-nucleotidase SurE n=1 Tax=Pseudonocardia sp. KRD291 TaxID=2792007 RepID=UPI001C5C3517|nr:5'/3'-nucleotidase SurE [Pseudonocardia sp. KRD291]MBW0102297.1 5'/3'-nucleotidase SurE [Pseudonocardia sp. KRD291]
MRPELRALVTNDDGVDSPGLAVLARAAAEVGFDVVVAAPDRQYSGSAASLTAVQTHGRTVTEERPPCGGAPTYAVRAAPAHIVVAALSGWFDPPPDLVLSGVNRGSNVGRAILHSGTVGAALTAALHDRRGLAVSLDVALGSTRDEHWEAVHEHLLPVLGLVEQAEVGTVLSLNVPDLPADRHRELRSASLDPRGSVQTLVEESGVDGMVVREVEVAGPPEPGSDRALLADGHPTLTALHGVGEAAERIDLPDSPDRAGRP